jgi:hypothetical protein
MTPSTEPAQAGNRPHPADVRDPQTSIDMVRAARQRPMSERLEVALSWNAVAAELRAGLASAIGHTDDSR